jgi:hypothetical protein
MPNWVSNNLKISADQNILNQIKSTIIINDELDFNTIIPMPAHQPDINKPNAFFADGNLGQEERKKFGTNNWLDWSNTNWGTKWNAEETMVIDGNPLEISFNTAWSTVDEVIAQLSRMFPTAVIEYSFIDDSMEYSGFNVYQNEGVVDFDFNDGDDFILSDYDADPEKYLGSPQDYVDYLTLFESAGYYEIATAIKKFLGEDVK